MSVGPSGQNIYDKPSSVLTHQESFGDQLCMFQWCRKVTKSGSGYNDVKS